MSIKDIHTNIMFDLECAGRPEHHNPAIIQLSAIHFNIDTGEELDIFNVIINLDSCSDKGLIVDNIEWLRQNIPQTLQQSRVSKIKLRQALLMFTRWLESRFRITRIDLRPGVAEMSDFMIWAFPSRADAVWIRSAYKACGLELPWKHYNDVCVRTMIKQCASITGVDYMRGSHYTRQGPKHDAVQDYKYQIVCLVKARNALKPAKRVKWSSVGTNTTSMDSLLLDANISDLVNALEIPQKRRRLKTEGEEEEETRFRSTVEEYPLLATPNVSQELPIEPKREPLAETPVNVKSKPYLITPQTSFSK